MPGRRGDMGYEDGEVELEEGEAALGGADGYAYAYGNGGGELVDPDALTYIVRCALCFSFSRLVYSVFPADWMDG